MSDVMDLGQLASYLRMSRASVYHLLSAGRIPGTKVGRQWRFSRASIDRWLQGQGETKGISVLVVDDDFPVRHLVSKALGQAGHEVTSACSVVEATALLGELEFDLLMLDLLLPDGTGLDIITRARRLSLVSDVVILTAHPKHELLEPIGILAPEAVVIAKPVRLARLVELAEHTAQRTQDNPRPNAP